MPDYTLQLASDVGARDGLGLELHDGRTLLAEVFRDDITGARQFTTFASLSLPVDVIHWFLGQASARL